MSLNLLCFQLTLKSAGAIPLHKKGKKDLKENYRLVSIPPILSKVFERTMFAQIQINQGKQYLVTI